MIGNDPIFNAELWWAKLAGEVRADTWLTRINRHHNMREAIVAAVGGWRAEKAVAGTHLELGRATDRVKIRVP